MLRPADKAKLRHGAKRPAAPACDSYAPGHFTALMRAHDWPPGFVSALAVKAPGEHNAQALADHARRNREAGIGFGQGGGTVKMPGTPHANRPPGWLKK